MATPRLMATSTLIPKPLRGRRPVNTLSAKVTCKAGIVPNNPSAFPPSLEVRCTNAAGAWQGLFLQSFCISSVPGGQMRTTPWQGLFPTILLHFRHPWRSDGGGTTAGMQELEQRRKRLPRTASGRRSKSGRHITLPQCVPASAVAQTTVLLASWFRLNAPPVLLARKRHPRAPHL